MADALKAPTIMVSVAALAAERGPLSVHYSIPLDIPRVYRWSAGSLLTEDSVAVIGSQGGSAGKWVQVRYADNGTNLTDAVASITVGGKPWRILPAGTLSQNRIATLSTTNAADGDIILITRLDVEAFTYAIVNGGPGAGTLFTFAVSQAAWAEFYFNGTNWLLRRAANHP